MSTVQRTKSGYQGRIFSRDGSAGTTTDLEGRPLPYSPLSQTSYGEPDGLFGINCGHQQYPFIPGVSMRTYYPYPEEQNAERYQQTQQQRAMERKIRADKRKCMMMQETGDEEGLKKAAGKLRADKDRYRDFCKETGLGAHNENTQVYGYDRSKSMKTVWSERKATAQGLTRGENGGIIKKIELPPETDEIRSMSKETRSLISKAFDDLKRDYDIRIDLIETIPLGDEYQKVPFLFFPKKGKDGELVKRIVINSRYDFMGSQAELQARIMRNYNSGALASDSIEGLISHELAHIMTFQDTFTFSGYLLANKQVSEEMVYGISRYADASMDGAECIAEAFAAKRCGHPVSEDAQKLLNKYIERWRK